MVVTALVGALAAVGTLTAGAAQLQPIPIGPGETSISLEASGK